MNAKHLRDLAEGDTIVLVPGIDGTALLFYRQIPLLAERFNVVAFPLPDDPRATMESLAANLANLVREVAPEGAVLLGESFGGALAMSTALAEPEVVRGLVIVNSFPWLHNRLQVHAGRFLLRLIPWPAMAHIRRGTESRIHSPHTNAEDLAEFRRRMMHIGPAGYRRRLDILGDFDIRDELENLSAPTLLLAGDHDRLIPSVRWACYMRERIPDSTQTVLEGYGHVCLINHDLDLRELIVPWWDDISVGREPEGSRQGLGDGQ